MKLRILYIAIFVLGVLLGGCSADLSDYENHKEQLVLQIDPVTSAQIQTRATEVGETALNENIITKLNIFVYPNNATGTTPCLYYEQIGGLNFAGVSGSSQPLLVAPSNFTLNALYDVYVVANLPSDVSVSSTITLDQLKALSSQTALDAAATQSAFVMDCKTSVTLNTGALLVHVPILLKRAVSKIRLNIVIPSTSPMVSATSSTVQLKSYVQKGAIVDAVPYSIVSADYNNTAAQTKPIAQKYIFYSYQNNWSSTPNRETYVVMNIPNFGVPNYYRIAVNPYADLNTDGQGGSLTNNSGKLQRNVLYDVTTYVDKIGGNSETNAVSLSGNYSRVDWSTGGNVDVNIANNHWLIVKEYQIAMNNVTTYSVGFTTDILPVTVINLTATYVTYSNTGVPSTNSYVSGNAQFPTVTVNPATMQIAITSAIPTNYGPKVIKFQVTNGTNTSGVITVTQYPPIYVTGRVSTGNLAPDWANHGSVNTLYTVNTTVPSTDGSYILGDPANGGLLTDSTATGKLMLSPQYVVASEWGASSQRNYVSARIRCTKFAEDVYRSGWRMPTQAEYNLMRKIQTTSGAVVTSFMQNNSPYWSAFQYQNFSFTSGTWSNATASTTAYVRCVYDVYKL